MLSVTGKGLDIFAVMLTYPLQQDHSRAEKFFRYITQCWFILFLLGQLLFASYIFLFYWRSAIMGQPESWNEVVAGLYAKGAHFKNTVFALHVFIAAIISLIGPLQLIPALRAYAPRFHRISGRIYIFFAFAIGIDGLLLVWRKGAVGGTVDHAIISVNALIILVCAYATIKHATKRQLKAHNRWAVHLVLAMSGVWLFRVFLMCWLAVNQKPVGFDPDTFTGPFLTFLSISVYILPQVIVWQYFNAREAIAPGKKRIFSTLLLFITLTMAIGIFAATMGLWLPRIKG